MADKDLTNQPIDAQAENEAIQQSRLANELESLEPSDEPDIDQHDGSQKDIIDQIKDLRDQLKERQAAKDIEKPSEPAAVEPESLPSPTSDQLAGQQRAAVTETSSPNIVKDASHAVSPEAEEFEKNQLKKAASKKVETRAVSESAKKAAGAVAKKEAAAAVEKTVAKVAIREVALGALSAGWAFVAQAALYVVGNKRARQIVIWSIIFVIFMPLIIIFLIQGLRGTASTPASAQDKSQADLLAARANDAVALRRTIETQTDKALQQLSTYKQHLTTTYKNDSAKQSSAGQAIDAIVSDIKAYKLVTDKNAQVKALDDLEAKIKAFYNQYPEVIGIGGSCKDLQPYIDSGSMTWLKPGPDKQLISTGFLVNIDRQRVQADPFLCQTALLLLKNGFKIENLTTADTHKAHTLHYYGKGMDIATINDIPFQTDAGRAQAAKLQQLIFDHRQELHVYELFGPSGPYILAGKPVDSISASLSEQHKTHVHVAVKE